jgi:hypothetical protein
MFQKFLQKALVKMAFPHHTEGAAILTASYHQNAFCIIYYLLNNKINRQAPV